MSQKSSPTYRYRVRNLPEEHGWAAELYVAADGKWLWFAKNVSLARAIDDCTYEGVKDTEIAIVAADGSPWEPGR
ncbi:MAG TPA: hypothetical protein VFG83_16790 [Kofleriaceae bacterium]|nr:hypothetical protein [Kofleriaceae bacterium]